jgi:hypothetical protein
MRHAKPPMTEDVKLTQTIEQFLQRPCRAAQVVRTRADRVSYDEGTSRCTKSMWIAWYLSSVADFGGAGARTWRALIDSCPSKANLAGSLPEHAQTILSSPHDCRRPTFTTQAV